MFAIENLSVIEIIILSLLKLNSPSLLVILRLALEGLDHPSIASYVEYQPIHRIYPILRQPIVDPLCNQCRLVNNVVEMLLNRVWAFQKHFAREYQC